MKGDRDLVARAKAFAQKAHRAMGQKRKYTGEPYIVHPQAVAQLVASVTDDPQVIAAAWLHDVVEDTSVTLKDIEEQFGTRVMELVADLTDVSRQPDGNRAVRKAIDLAHTAKASPEAKTIKLADLIDNCRSIVAHDSKFAPIYLEEMARLLEVLKDGHPVLYQMAREELEKARETLGQESPPPEKAPGGTLDPGKRSLYLRLKRLFYEGFTAMDIAAPLVPMEMEREDEEILAAMEEKGVSVVGLLEKGTIKGYAFRQEKEGEITLTRRPSIPEGQILPAEAPLADVIRVLANREYCFLSAFGGIEGMVTREDIQKPPGRMWLFGMITIIEMYLTRLIEPYYPQDSWHGLISPGRLEKARELASERARRGQRVSLLDCLQLPDKAIIMVKDRALRRDFGLSSMRDAKQTIKDLESLRNNLAHSQDIVTEGWNTIVKLATRMDRILTRI